jgi:membrane protease YdiL (CAAX protease family)
VNAPDIFDQATHDYEALKDYRYFSGLMTPEEEQRETWHRDTLQAEHKGRASLIRYDEWPNAPKVLPAPAPVGKHRIGPYYQLLFLGLLLVGSQYGLFVILSIAVWLVVHAPVASTSNDFNHLCIIGAEWLQLACVWFVTRSGFRPFDFIGKAQSRKQLCLEVCLGIGLGVAEAIYTVLPRTLHTAHAHLSKPLSGEVILLIGVSLSAGIVEEIVYRGYLQQLLIDCLDNVWLAIGIQAVVFALAHSYQGLGAVITIAGQSVLTGYLAYRLKNLRLVIVAHCTLDLIAGLAGGL